MSFVYTAFIIELVTRTGKETKWNEMNSVFDDFIQFILKQKQDTKLISDNHLLLIHIVFISYFRSLNNANCCDQGILSRILSILLSTFDSAKYSWILVLVFHDLMDALYALYNFDIMIQIKKISKKTKEIKTKTESKANDKESILLLSLQRWYIIIYHIYHRLKLTQNINQPVLNSKYIQTISTEIMHCIQTTKYNIDNDAFDNAIGFKIVLDDVSHLNFLRCNLMQIVSKMYSKIHDDLSGNILVKMQKIICFHLSYLKHYNIQHNIYCNVFSFKFNEIRSKCILPSIFKIFNAG